MESLDFTLWRLEEHRCFTAKNSDLHGSKIKSVALKIRCTESTFPEQRLMRRNIPPPLPQASVVLVDPLDHQILDRELDQLANWPITADQRRRLIDYVLVKAREMVERMPPHHNSAQLQFVVEVCHMRMNPEMNTEERLLMEEPGPNRMVPAEESSIESLVKRRFTDHEYSGDCSVCLEEMLLGTQVTSMPCAHVFHGDCIQKWLRTSRYCPVCRFQMPTGEVVQTNWPIPAPRRREMIDDLLRKARETVPHHKSAQLHFGVDVTRVNVVDGHREMERLLTQRSMEESSGAGGMVPAEESSIESLEKTRFTEDSGDCSVCLEEMLLGSQVTSMPCAHVFHGDCIQKWLRTSRYCPVCRFEMPTS